MKDEYMVCQVEPLVGQLRNGFQVRGNAPEMGIGCRGDKPLDESTLVRILYYALYFFAPETGCILKPKRIIFEEDRTMFEKTPRNSGRYPWKMEADSVGQDLNKLLDEMVRQGHVDKAQDILEPIVASALNLLDDNTVSSEIKALAASFLRTYGEDWTVRYDEKTWNQIKELLGE